MKPMPPPRGRHEWACTRHPHERADGPGLCPCGRARIPVDDIRRPEDARDDA